MPGTEDRAVKKTVSSLMSLPVSREDKKIKKNIPVMLV